MKRVFLTGASSGIGLATAQALAAAGHEVWGTSRDPERLPRLDHFHPVRLDLRDGSQIEEVFAAASAGAGFFDTVINNAGSGHFGPGELLSPSEIADQFQVLVFAQVRLMQLALAQMQPRNTGLIINVTSLAGRLPVPFMAAYNAAKAALSIFTVSVQLELGRSGVRVVDLQPADISTQFNDGVIKGQSDARYADRIAKTWKTVDHNMKTAPPPDVVARAILQLLDQQNPPPRLTVGGFFQAQIAPLIFRLLPQRVRIWGLKLYYGL
jgi:NAD(P)-dependent dehydrogenase (short-subunit alcohol dehydrogenase family)